MGALGHGDEAEENLVVRRSGGRQILLHPGLSNDFHGGTHGIFKLLPESHSVFRGGLFPDGRGLDELHQPEGVGVGFCENTVGQPDHKHALPRATRKSQGSGKQVRPQPRLAKADRQEEVFLAGEMVVDGRLGIFDSAGEIIEIQSGNGEGQIRLPKLNRKVMKQKRNYKPAQVTEVRRRLEALAAQPMSAPKGPMPKSARAARGQRG